MGDNMKQFEFNGKTIKTTLKNGEPVFHAGDLVESLGFMRSHPQKTGTWMYNVKPFHYIEGSNKYWSEESVNEVDMVLSVTTKRESSKKLLDAIKQFNDDYGNKNNKTNQSEAIAKKEITVKDSRSARVVDKFEVDGDALVITSDGKEYKRSAVKTIALSDKVCAMSGKIIHAGESYFYVRIGGSSKHYGSNFHIHKSCFDKTVLPNIEQEQHEVILDSPDSNLENIKPHESITPLYYLSAIQVILMLIIIFNDLSK